MSGRVLLRLRVLAVREILYEHNHAFSGFREMRRGVGDTHSRRSEAQRLLLAATLLTCVLLFAASRQLRAPAGDKLGFASHAQPHLKPAPLVAFADIHGDLENALLSLQLRRAPCEFVARHLYLHSRLV